MDADHRPKASNGRRARRAPLTTLEPEDNPAFRADAILAFVLGGNRDDTDYDAGLVSEVISSGR